MSAASAAAESAGAAGRAVQGGHRLVVEAVEDLTPGMRRVVFGGPGVASYLAAGPHVPNIKLYFPAPGAELDLPEKVDGRWSFEPGQRERVRTYTVRRLDRDASRLAVDFVRHGDEGLASAWAERAVPGAELGALGGGGLVVRDGAWVLLAGDETALPAIGSTLERFAAERPEQRGLALIEVAGPEEEQDLTAPDGFEVRWLHRRPGGAAAPASSRPPVPAGTTKLLQEALAAVELPAAELAAGQVRIWVSAESAVVRFARAHLKRLGFDRRHQLIIGYWHRGMTETGYTRSTDHDRERGELADVLPGQEHAHAH